MRLVLDAGALIGLERADRRVAGLILLARRAGGDLVTTAPVVGQVWRDGARQARLARDLSIVDIKDVTAIDGRRAGELLREAGATDVVDALVVLLANPGDQILTGDPDELAALVEHRAGPVAVVAV
jgi:hypothetical protein